MTTATHWITIDAQGHVFADVVSWLIANLFINTLPMQSFDCLHACYLYINYEKFACSLHDDEIHWITIDTQGHVFADVVTWLIVNLFINTLPM